MPWYSTWINGKILSEGNKTSNQKNGRPRKVKIENQINNNKTITDYFVKKK